MPKTHGYHFILGINPNMTQQHHDHLIVKDVDFMVYQQIEDGPDRLMIRKLLMNGIEAVMTVPDHREIVFSSVLFEGTTPKICIRNTGTGMNAEELYAAGDLACISNKEHGLDKNFGQGAKIASLKYNHLGMVYTSCKDGVASRMTLARTGSSPKYRYSRISHSGDFRVVSSVAQSILNVTDEYSDEDLANDWTQVVLLGNSETQDTTTDPYGTGKESVSWLAEEIYHRFYHIDPSIKVRVKIGHRYVNTISPNRLFETMEHRRFRITESNDGIVQEGVFTRSETVETASGIKLHFIYDAPYKTYRISSTRGPLQSDMTIGGIIYRNEIYGLVKGGAWTGKAPSSWNHVRCSVTPCSC